MTADRIALLEELGASIHLMVCIVCRLGAFRCLTLPCLFPPSYLSRLRMERTGSCLVRPHVRLEEVQGQSGPLPSATQPWRVS